MAKSMTNYEIERGIQVPKNRLHPNPWNPNKMTVRQQSAVDESIQSYGQVLELLVRPHPDVPGDYQIIDGEHRFNVLPDTVYCNVIHGLPESEAKKLTIVMNETRGKADEIELAQLLSELNTDMGMDLVNALPYSQSELDDFLSLASVSSEDQYQEPNTEIPEIGNDSQDPWDSFMVKLPADAMIVVGQAADLIRDSRNGEVHQDRAIAWGQIIEALAADYLGR